MEAMDERQQQQPLLSRDETHFHNTKNSTTQFFLFLARWVLKITMWVIFIAWVSVFFVIPSSYGNSFYNSWVDATDGTLFGETGSVMLLYSGPVLIIAILAIPYLFISGREEEQFQKKKTPRFRLWTFPVLVEGPFGVVSAAELIGIILFPLFVVWAIYSYTVTNFIMLPSYGDLSIGEKRTFMLQMSAYCFGCITISCVAFLFIPIARGSILLRLIDIPFEHATKYHVWLGNLIMFLATVHGACYMIVWIVRGIVLKSIVEWKSDGGANFAGVITYCFGLVMWVTTLPPVRKKYFELFYYTHQLYIFFIIFLALHIGGTNFSIVSGGILLFMLDRFVRFWQSRRPVSIISATSFSCGAVKLVLSKPANLSYNALGFIFLRIRKISQLQWHPFSVSSSPLDGKNHLSVLIKAGGDWTSKLKGEISNISAEESQTEFLSHPHYKNMAYVEGPYGHESPYYLMYENLVLVAGGSGISPFLAILSDILHRIKENKPCLPRNILIVWAVKNSNELSLLSAADMESICPFFSDKLNLELQAYVTRELDPPLEEGKVNNVLSSYVFPASTGCQMSVLVGTGNKFWSGIYVVSSTIGLIICLGLLDVFYINPFSIAKWWYLGFLLLACMVASVIIFGGTVVGLWHLWGRRTSASEKYEDGTIQHKHVTDKDVLQQQFASSSTIMYGCRPDFKEIFGSITKQWGHVDVGVIVCGPSSLQSSVAKECRTQNLRRERNDPIFHYNSHSFDL